MCGIILVKRLDDIDARNQASYRYEAQKGRGQEGYGFVALDQKGKMISYERAETEAEIKEKLKGVPCSDIMFHHRFPTSTPNFTEAAHPIKVSHEKLKYDYYVVHNGIITDDEDWRTEHLAEGFVYTTEMSSGFFVGGKLRNTEIRWNDSEAFAIELALDLDLEGGGVNCAGSIAFVTMQVEKATGQAVNIFWGRNYKQPLVFNHSEQVFFSVCSEGNGESCKAETLHSFNYESGKISERPYHVGLELARVEEEDVRLIDLVGTQPRGRYNDFGMPDRYYILLENRAELESLAAGLEARGEETNEIEYELTLLEDEIELLEDQYDERELDIALEEKIITM